MIGKLVAITDAEAIYLSPYMNGAIVKVTDKYEGINISFEYQGELANGDIVLIHSNCVREASEEEWIMQRVLGGPSLEDSLE